MTYLPRDQNEEGRKNNGHIRRDQPVEKSHMRICLNYKAVESKRTMLYGSTMQQECYQETLSSVQASDSTYRSKKKGHASPKKMA